jgi:uncharacterized repeat protein (TIGR02543 family)
MKSKWGLLLLAAGGIIGWKYFKRPAPAHLSIATQLQSISGQLLSVYGVPPGAQVPVGLPDSSWLIYKPNDNSSTLKRLEDGKGYWINVSAICTLTYPNGKQYACTSGWNLIGWLESAGNQDSANLATQIASIISNVDSLWAYRGGVWAANMPYMLIGAGYFIHMKAPATLSYGGFTYPLIAGWNLIGWRGETTPGGGGSRKTLIIQASTGGTTNPAPGAYPYNSGVQITITAIPNSGYTFSGWSGSATGNINPLTVTVDSDKTIKANFVPSGGGGVGTVTVRVKATNYGSRAKYWVAMPYSIASQIAVPITQELTWQNIPADDLMKGSLVDMFDADPTYGGGQSLRGQDGYPNLAIRLSAARLLNNGELLTWVSSPNGWWKDQSGQWV